MLFAPAMSEASCAPERCGGGGRDGAALLPPSVGRPGAGRCRPPALPGGERARRSGGGSRARRLGSSSSGERGRRLADVGLGLARRRRPPPSFSSGERRRLGARCGERDSELCAARRPVRRPRDGESESDDEEAARRGIFSATMSRPRCALSWLPPTTPPQVQVQVGNRGRYSYMEVMVIKHGKKDLPALYKACRPFNVTS